MTPPVAGNPINRKAMDFCSIPPNNLLDLYNDTIPPVGGRLGHFVSAWENITPSPWVLEMIVEGYHLELVACHPAKFYITDLIIHPEKQMVLEHEVRTLLQNGS